MKCPFCSQDDTQVIDSRVNEQGNSIRRRRRCSGCEKRFTTYERVELDLNIIKKDGRREKFTREKLFVGVEKNLQKRPFSSEQIEEIVDEIVARVYRVAKDKDITSSRVGQIVMDKLKKVDKIAYVRFAAVYRDFADIDDFKKELKELK